MTRPILALILAAALPLAAAPALSQTAAPAPDGAAASAPASGAAPAADAAGTAGPVLPLSQLLGQIEGEAAFQRFDDIEWDERDGTWEIEYRQDGGRKVSVEIDGRTGEPVDN